jgi:hypothetical protein
MSRLLVVVALIGCGGEKKGDGTDSKAKAELQMRRDFAAKAEDVWRKNGVALSARLRGRSEDVLVFSKMVMEGEDMCSQLALDKAFVGPDSQSRRNYQHAGIVRVECETTDGRVFGVELSEPTTSRTVDSSPAAVTKRQMAELVGAFDGWRQANPEKTCPASVSELLVYLSEPDYDAKHVIDAWQHSFELRCDHTNATAPNFGVWSRGPDGQVDTADDLRSWE